MKNTIKMIGEYIASNKLRDETFVSVVNFKNKTDLDLFPENNSIHAIFGMDDYYFDYEGNQIDNPEPTIYTHNGMFHPDEVVACALLRIAGIEYSITRTRDMSLVTQKDILIDVGGEFKDETYLIGMSPWDGAVLFHTRGSRFDHHQLSLDDDQYGLSSAGMVFRSLIRSEPLTDYQNGMDYMGHGCAFGNTGMHKSSSVKYFIEHVDARDVRNKKGYESWDFDTNSLNDTYYRTGSKYDKFCQAISNLNAIDIYGEEQAEAFEFAVDSAIKYIKELIGGSQEPTISYLKEVADRNVASKKAELKDRQSKLHYWSVDSGKKAYVVDGEKHLPGFMLPKDWDFFVSWDSGQKCYTVMANTAKGIVLDQDQGDNCLFVHKAGFTGKFKAAGWREQQQLFRDEVDFISNGSRCSVPVGEEYW